MTTRAGVVVLILAAVAAGCARGSGSDTFVTRLAMIPATVTEDTPGADQPIMVSMADLDRAATLADVTRPGDPTDTQAVNDYLLGITGMIRDPADEPARVVTYLPETWGSRLSQAAEMRDDLGWSIADVSWFVEYRQMPEYLVVLDGDFDADQLTDTIGPPEDDIWKLGDTDYGRDNQPSAGRPIGQHLRFGLDGSRLFVSPATPPIADALAGDGPTLADNPALGAMAAALDAEDAYSAIMMTGTSFPLDFGAMVGTIATPEQAAAMLEDAAALPVMFTGVAVGLAVTDEDARHGILVYTHNDRDSAETNAEGVETLIREGTTQRTSQPWSEQFSVDEVRTDDTTVIVRLRLAPNTHPGIMYQLLQQRDNLISHH